MNSLAKLAIDAMEGTISGRNSKRCQRISRKAGFYGRLRARQSFAGRTLETPWTDLLLAYFAGFEMWT
jgi:hypothetical protein